MSTPNKRHECLPMKNTNYLEVKGGALACWQPLMRLLTA
jgi:hypothetical protein